MATLALTAVGTAIGGPLGGAIGSLIGSRIDGALFGPAARQGPRLTELAVSTSSYGTPLARHFGTIRAPGTIIWSTDLIESSEASGGGKGRPSATTYSYSISFAVALASRPIAAVKRIWADGNLLRGEGGDLKVGGAVRVYDGYGDQAIDPLLASAEGNACPAFRGLAYCVFEDLQLGEFGNRIPALTFEIVADTGEVSLAALLGPLDQTLEITRDLGDLEGFTDNGGPLDSALRAIDSVFPVAADTSQDKLLIAAGDSISDAIALPVPVVDRNGEGFGETSGLAGSSRSALDEVPTGLRYYDIDRDYQPGLQRAGGRARSGRDRIIEFPGAFRASAARQLAQSAAQRASSSSERMSYRIAEIDPNLRPGTCVTVPGRAGSWRIEAWEWRSFGVELELARLPQRTFAAVSTDAGRALHPRDAQATPTLLDAFELPWDGNGSPNEVRSFVAASSAGSGWTGATLYADHVGELVPIGGTGKRRAILGRTLAALPPSNCLLFERASSIEVELAADDLALDPATPEQLAAGANRALVDAEIVQFARATRLDGRRWVLAGLLRGRGGTEPDAVAGTPAGATFVLLDQGPIALSAASVVNAEALAAIGLADAEPVIAPIRRRGASLRPLTPVHARASQADDGTLQLSWTRRARGSWSWSATVEVPLVEETEAYEVGIGDPGQPDILWQVTAPVIEFANATIAQMSADYPNQRLWVRQVGSHARSAPLILFSLSGGLS